MKLGGGAGQAGGGSPAVPSLSGEARAVEDAAWDLPGGEVTALLLSLQDKHCFYNGKTQWEASGPSGGAAGCFVPFAVCVVSRFPYYNALKDCLSW